MRWLLVDQNEKLSSFACADAALAVSGTVIMELALAGVPTVVMYKGILYMCACRGLYRCQDSSDLCLHRELVYGSLSASYGHGEACFCPKYNAELG